uniref:POLG alternative reading frame-like n=1 Tax=Nyctereutes procyonoides TaxID=34880 RepID=UPI002444020C|nr:POLG alternative reading frame-like [Nyctereutes procyonoides]
MALSRLRGPGCPGGAPGRRSRDPAAPSGAREAPGRAAQGSGVWKAPELLWKCRGAWTRRLRAPAAPAAAPLRLPAAAAAAASALAGGRRAASSRAGGWGASAGGAAAALAAVAVAVGRAPSLRPGAYFIALRGSLRSGLGFTKRNSQPAASREGGGAGAPGRSVALPPPLPGNWSRPAVSRGVRSVRRAPAGSQKPSVPGRARPPSGGGVSVSVTKPGGKKMRTESPRCCHPLPPASAEGRDWARQPGARGGGVRGSAIV